MKRILAMLAAASALIACKGQGGEEEFPSYEGTVIYNKVVPTTHLTGKGGIMTVYLPADWETSGKTYPVLYLLHGAWSHNNEWMEKGDVFNTTKTLINYGSCHELIVVTPLCNDDCFYVDGYVKGMDYETFFFEDLMPFVEKTYPVKTGRENTAIAGLSMGGFGCSYYAFTHPEKFCLCWSMSGALEGMGNSLVPSVKTIFETMNYGSGDFKDLPEYHLECGTEDFLIGANESTHRYLDSIGFPHEYITRPGAHDWTFWKASYPNVLRAFSALLDKQK